MMKIPLLTIGIALIGFKAGEEGNIPHKVCELPDALEESSGLLVEGSNKCWSINDSGHEPELIAFDSSGRKINQNRIRPANNKDWETLARKGDTVFIGDVGNNKNQRKDLQFYAANWKGKALFTIPFQYPDQKQFPPPRENRNFDLEASFYLDGNLYLFSKTRELDNPHTKIYQLPAREFEKPTEPTLLDSLNIASMITGATLSPNGNKVLLMSYGRVYRLQPFAPDKLNSLRVDSLSIPVSQTEAVAYLNDSVCYYTNEQGTLYRLNTGAFD